LQENAKQYLDSSVDYKETKRRNKIAGIASDILYQDIEKEVKEGEEGGVKKGEKVKKVKVTKIKVKVTGITKVV
jgi:hypothetical protein